MKEYHQIEDLPIALQNEIKDIDICVDIENGGVLFSQFLYEKGYTQSSPKIFQTYGTSMFHLKEYPDLVAFRHPITGKITEVLNKEDSIRFREKIQEADNDIAEGRIYSLKNIDDNFWQEINSGD